MLLHHPSFPDVIEDVPADAVSDWLAAGWLEEPAVPAPATPPADSAPAATPDTIEPSIPSGDEQDATDNSEVPAETQE